MTSVNVSQNVNLEILNCNSSQIASLDVTHNINLKKLFMSSNLLTSLDVSQNTLLDRIDCNDNHLANLDISHNAQLIYLYCFNNQITNLDISNNTLLRFFYCNNNLLTSLDTSHNLDLWTLKCQNNQLTSLDVSHCVHYLSTIDCSNNQLSTLFIKNGLNESSLIFTGNPNLNYICADEIQVSSVQAQAGSNIVVSSYCSFTPGGNFNTVSGMVRFDMNNNGCDANDVALPNSLHLNIAAGTVSSGTFPTTDGSYLLYTLTGTNTLTASLENPSYFTITPSTTTITTTTLGNTQTQDFCLTSNGIHNDAEIVITPIILARPGFYATYRVNYKNKGNQILSGNINFNYDSDVAFLDSSSEILNMTSLGNLSLDYTNLLPFESRSFDIKFYINAPTDYPPIHIGDFLNYTATINPITGDETPADNVFNYHQTVIGSYDPNNKTCLEGDTVSTTKIGDYLHYNINFENTGTAAAQNIVVKDIIDTTKYDINSLQIMNSSHPVTTRITGNKVEFIFQNINLGASQYGNVVFKLKTLSNLTTGATATNSANIYFDYNAPITTNTASTTFQLLNNAQFAVDNSIMVSPNPTSSKININSNNTIQSVQVYDIQGRLLETQLVNDSKTTINLSEKTMGIYFLKITSDNGSKVEKIIKE